MLAHRETQQRLQSEGTGDAGCLRSALVHIYLLPRQPSLVTEQRPCTALVMFGAALATACTTFADGQAAFTGNAPHQQAPSLTCQLQASLQAAGQVEAEVLHKADLAGR